MTSTNWLELKCGRQRWWVHPAWRDRLLDDHGLRLDEWERQGAVEIVKHSVNRTVYRVNTPAGAVFIKHYPVDDRRAWARQRLRPAKALREWRQAALLHQQEVPTISPLAVGASSDGASYFVTEALEDTIGLYEYVQRHLSAWRRGGDRKAYRSFLQEISGFLALLHRSGLVHDDLHAENVLVRKRPHAGHDWFLIDPYTVRQACVTWSGRLLTSLRRFVSRDDSRANIRTSLALLGMAFWQDLTLTDRLRCWRTFQQGCPAGRMSREHERRFLQSLEAEVWRRTYGVWSKRADRCVEANRDFFCLAMDEGRVWASRCLPSTWLHQVMGDPRRPLSDSRTRILKTSRHGQVGLIHGPDGNLLTYKRFSPRRPRERWFAGWRESPARRCYRMAYHLQLARIPTARPLAVLEPRNRAASYLVLQYVPDAVGLIEYVARCRQERCELRLRSLARRLAVHVRRMHRFGLSHRDLKVANLLVQETPGEAPEPVLIDLRGVYHHRWLTRARQAKDLARLALSAVTTLEVSRSNLLRFLLSYLREERSSWRSWWRLILRYSTSKAIQNLRRQRIVS